MNRAPNDEEDKIYNKTHRLAVIALTDLQTKISEAVEALGDPYLIRARLTEPRIKSPSSLRRKAQQRGWTFAKALLKAQDLVGLRLVCNNLQDVRRAADLLESALLNTGIIVKRDDCTMEPRQTGYRAIHLIFRFSVRMGMDESDLGCEIQIRSLLQNSWAELSRADVYYGEDFVPKSIERRMLALSKLLSRADEVADKIRVDISKPLRGRRPKAGQPLSASSLAFLFRQRFDEDPPEYVVQSVLRELEGSPIRGDGLATILQDEAYNCELKSAYSNASGWEADPIQIFRWAVLSLVVGRDAAVRLAAREGRLEGRERAAFVAREIMGGFSSAEEVAESLENVQKDEDPESDIETWASVLGVSRNCSFCGTTIIDPEELAEAVVKYFGVRGRRADNMCERLSDAVRSSAIEIGSWGDSNVCSHCAYTLGDDD